MCFIASNMEVIAILYYIANYHITKYNIILTPFSGKSHFPMSEKPCVTLAIATKNIHRIRNIVIVSDGAFTNYFINIIKLPNNILIWFKLQITINRKRNAFTWQTFVWHCIEWRDEARERTNNGTDVLTWLNDWNSWQWQKRCRSFRMIQPIGQYSPENYRKNSR